jgi:hypothetical protein
MKNTPELKVVRNKLKEATEELKLALKRKKYADSNYRHYNHTPIRTRVKIIPA